MGVGGIQPDAHVARVEQVSTRTATRQVLDLYGLTISAAGTFEPGRPIVLTARLRSVIPSNAELQLEALDVPDDSTHVRTMRPCGSWSRRAVDG